MYQHIAGELHGSPLARLALETLGSFNFGPIGLLEFAREHVLQWLDDADISVRKAAALCAARILNRHVTETKRPARHLVRRRAGPKHAQSRGDVCRMLHDTAGSAGKCNLLALASANLIVRCHQASHVCCLRRILKKLLSVTRCCAYCRPRAA